MTSVTVVAVSIGDAALSVDVAVADDDVVAVVVVEVVVVAGRHRRATRPRDLDADAQTRGAKLHEIHVGAGAKTEPALGNERVAGQHGMKSTSRRQPRHHAAQVDDVRAWR